MGGENMSLTTTQLTVLQDKLTMLIVAQAQVNITASTLDTVWASLTSTQKTQLATSFISKDTTGIDTISSVLNAQFKAAAVTQAQAIIAAGAAPLDILYAALVG